MQGIRRKPEAARPPGVEQPGSCANNSPLDTLERPPCRVAMMARDATVFGRHLRAFTSTWSTKLHCRAKSEDGVYPLRTSATSHRSP